ncbi:hypothetical protein QFZ75_007570 [Streptomyces sp. V3I8]|nr:hypothetical protein [Streptomyces sp. V3I8]
MDLAPRDQPVDRLFERAGVSESGDCYTIGKRRQAVDRDESCRLLTAGVRACTPDTTLEIPLSSSPALTAVARWRACSGCRRPTHKYGSGGLPLCQWCLASARENWGPAVRFNNTRPQSE